MWAILSLSFAQKKSKKSLIFVGSAFAVGRFHGGPMRKLLYWHPLWLPNHTYNLPDSRIFTCYHTELTWIPVLFLFPTTRSLVSPTCSWSYSNMSGSVEPEILGLWDGQQRCRGLVGTLDFGLAWDAVSMLRRKQQNQILSCPSLVSLIRWDSIYVNMNVSVFCINVSPSWTLNQGSFL